MSKFLFLILVILKASNACCQCQTTEETDPNKSYRAIRTAYEKIYTNEDLENGVLTYSIRLFTIIQKRDSSAPSFYLQCLYGRSLNYTIDIVPRRIIITFTDGTSNTIIADNEDQAPTVEGASMRKFTSKLDKDQCDQLVSHHIKTITFFDNRTNGSVSSPVYADILLEQMNCLRRRADP